MWLEVCERIQVSMTAIGNELNVQVQDRWVPIYPELGVEYPEVLEDVVQKLRYIAIAIRVATEAADEPPVG